MLVAKRENATRSDEECRPFLFSRGVRATWPRVVVLTSNNTLFLWRAIRRRFATSGHPRQSVDSTFSLLTGIQEASVGGDDSAVSLRGVHDGLIEDDLVLMLRRGVMGLGRLLVMLRMMVVGQVVVLLPLGRHAHRRRGPPSCELSLEACELTRFALIGTLFPFSRVSARLPRRRLTRDTGYSPLPPPPSACRKRYTRDRNDHASGSCAPRSAERSAKTIGDRTTSRASRSARARAHSLPRSLDENRRDAACTAEGATLARGSPTYSRTSVPRHRASASRSLVSRGNPATCARPPAHHRQRNVPPARDLSSHNHVRRPANAGSDARYTCITCATHCDHAAAKPRQSRVITTSVTARTRSLARLYCP